MRLAVFASGRSQPCPSSLPRQPAQSRNRLPLLRSQPRRPDVPALPPMPPGVLTPSYGLPEQPQDGFQDARPPLLGNAANRVSQVLGQPRTTCPRKPIPLTLHCLHLPPLDT